MVRTIERLLEAPGELGFLTQLEMDDLLRILVVIRASIEKNHTRL